MKLSRRNDAQPETSGENEPKNENKYRRSVLTYVTVMFAVVILLILLSYFMQQRNNHETINDITEQHKEFSTQALENIERLQEKNQELLTEQEESKRTAEEQKKQIDELKKELEKARKETLSEQNELNAKYNAIELLFSAKEALSAGDKAAAKKYMEELELFKDSLEEDWLKVYNDIAKTLNRGENND